MAVIDVAANTGVATIPVGNQPFAVAVNPAGTRAYVANFGSGTVSVIDTATNTVAATIPGVSSAGGVAVDPAGTRVYVSTNGGPTFVIDATTNTGTTHARTCSTLAPIRPSATSRSATVPKAFPSRPTALASMWPTASAPPSP